MISLTRIDGSQLEGGGQILRISLSLSCLLDIPIFIDNIRHQRPKPGLAAQHLEGIKLIKSISNKSKLDGGAIGSTSVTFVPGNRLQNMDFIADCGTAGSITLMIQISLPCISFLAKAVPSSSQSSQSFSNSSPLLGGSNSTYDGMELIAKVGLIGGTNVSTSPPIDHLQLVLLPLLEDFGIYAQANIIRRGYYPDGGGNVELQVKPVHSIHAITHLNQGSLMHLECIVYGNANQDIKSDFEASLQRIIQSNPLLSADKSSSINHVNFIKDTFHHENLHTLPSNQQTKQSSSSSSISLSTAVKSHIQIDGHNNNSRKHDTKQHTGKRSRQSAITGVGCLLVVKTSTGCVLSVNCYLDSKTNGKELSRTETDRLAVDILTDLRELIASGACVDEYTADQLIIYMALATDTSSMLIEPPCHRNSLHIVTAIKIATELTGAVFTLKSIDEVDEKIISGAPLSHVDGRCRVVTCKGIGFTTLSPSIPPVT